MADPAAPEQAPSEPTPVSLTPKAGEEQFAAPGLVKRQPSAPTAAQPQTSGASDGGRPASIFEARLGIKNPLLSERIHIDPAKVDFYTGLGQKSPDDVTTFPEKAGLSIYDMTVGPGLAALGVKHTQENFSWNLDNLKHQWAESPVWINALNLAGLAAFAFPIARSAQLTGRRVKNLAEPEMQFQRLKESGWIDENVKSANDLSRSSLNRMVNSFESYQRYTPLANRLEEYKRTLTRPGYQPDVPFSPSEKVKMWFFNNFANKYGGIVNDWSDQGPVRSGFHENLAKAVDTKSLNTFLDNLPAKEHGPDLYQHILARISPSIPRPATSNPQLEKVADDLFRVMSERQKSMVDDGIIFQHEYDDVGPAHLNALRKKFTPALSDPTAIDTKVRYDRKKSELVTYGFPHLDSPTLFNRNSTPQDILAALRRGELYTDPIDIVNHALIHDTLVQQAFRTVYDIAKNPAYSIPFTGLEAAKKSKVNLSRYVDLNSEAPHADRIRNMFVKKGDTDILGPNGELPYIHIDAFEDLFGPNGMFRQTQSAPKYGPWAVYTSILKTSVTALNPATQVRNLAANVPFAMQHGVNPFLPENAEATQSLYKAVKTITDYHRDNGRDRTVIRDLFLNPAKANIDLGEITLKGKKFNLNDEILDPHVLKVLEENAFETTESFNHVHHMANATEAGSFSRLLSKSASGLKDLSYRAGVGKYNLGGMMDYASRTYLASDMVPKLLSYFNQRALGFSRQAAMYEVGRRYPMYGTTGAMIQNARKVAFPWLSFPVESLRVTKNNLMDHPLKTLPWLMVPAAIQTTLSALRWAPAVQELDDERRGLPTHVQTPQTVLAYGNDTAGGAGIGALAGLNGAMAGGAAGAAIGGFPGAVVGAAAGGIGGYMLGKEAVDRVRGVILDFLPHSAFMLDSTSPDVNPTLPSYSVLASSLPFKPFPKYLAQSLIDQSPVKPLALMMPFINLMTGSDPQGNAVGGEGPGDFMRTVIATFTSNLLPPWISSNFMRPTGQVLSLSEALGHPIPGDPTNVYQFAKDLGLKPANSLRNLDPNTLKDADPPLNFWLRRMTGVLNSYPVDQENKVRAYKQNAQGYESVISYLSQEYRDAMANNNDPKARELVAKVLQTISVKRDNIPILVAQDMQEWMSSQVQNMMKNKAFQGMSEKDLLQGIAKSSHYAFKSQTEAQQQFTKFLLLMMEQSLLTAKPSGGGGPVPGQNSPGPLDGSVNAIFGGGQQIDFGGGLIFQDSKL